MLVVSKRNCSLELWGLYGVISKILRVVVNGFRFRDSENVPILKVGDAGFPPERSSIRQLAYQLAKKIGLKHNFNNENKITGPEWLNSLVLKEIPKNFCDKLRVYQLK